MNKRQQLVIASIDEALAYLIYIGSSIPEIAAAHLNLQAKRRNIADAVQSQAGAHRGARGWKLSTLRRELRVNHLLRIRKQGRVLLKGLPGIDDVLRVPHDRAPTKELVAAAKRIADAIRPHASAFHRAKFPRDFIKRMERAAAALDKAADAPISAMSDHPSATRALKEALQEGRLAIDGLDGLIVAAFPRGAHQVKTWKDAKRIRRPIGRPRQPKKARTNKPPPPPE